MMILKIADYKKCEVEDQDQMWLKIKVTFKITLLLVLRGKRGLAHQSLQIPL